MRVLSHVRKIPWRRARQPTPVFLPGESHGQKSLEGYSPGDHKELDTTEATSACTNTYSLGLGDASGISFLQMRKLKFWRKSITLEFTQVSLEAKLRA